MTVDVEEVKRNNPLPATIERFTGIRVERHKIRCPFHEDRTPSLQVYHDDSWHCFGCGAHGNDVIDFVGVYLFGHEYDKSAHFIDVVDRLGALDIKPLPKRTTKPLPKRSRKAELPSLEQVMLWSDKQPDDRRAYWHRRRLNDDAIRRFFLGWDGRRYTIPAHYRFQVFGVKRRKSEIDDGLPAKYVQIKGSRVGIFNADVLLEAKRVVICEGEIDCMLLDQAGYAAVTSTGGANSWKPKWARHFTHIRDIYLLFDNDQAGIDGARKVQANMRRARLLKLPDGISDVGDLFERHTQPKGWLKESIV